MNFHQVSDVDVTTQRFHIKTSLFIVNLKENLGEYGIVGVGVIENG